MTCREKLAIERPEELDSECFGGCSGCPDAYGYAKKPEWCKPNNETCTKCWDREVEEVDSGERTVEQKMTCREKLAMEHPEEFGFEFLGGCNDCPSAYGYAKDPEWCKPNNETCTKCWDREVEEVENEVKTEVDSGERTVEQKNDVS